MRHFHVILSGRGIRLPFEGEVAEGFRTILRVRAPDANAAEALAIERVLADWQTGGRHARDNLGAPPTLAVLRSFPVSTLRAFFTNAPRGYAFDTEGTTPADPSPTPDHPPQPSPAHIDTPRGTAT